MGVVIEHFAGSFPVWLAPVQAVAIPVADRHLDYARKVKEELAEQGLRVEVDDSQNSMQKKIRENSRQKIPYLLIVGDKEEEVGTVNVRRRGQKQQEEKDLGGFAEEVVADAAARAGVLLVRLWGSAAGVFDGTSLVSAKVGSRQVHGRSAAGGQSQQRFARRREGQARVALAAAAGFVSLLLLLPLWRLAPAPDLPRETMKA